jgi:hypothetical protein
MIPSSATERAGWIVRSTETTDHHRERLFAAQRDATTARLTGKGMTADLAERWLWAWEASSNMRAERYSVDFWERGGRWAATAWEAGQKPPTIEG